MYSIGLLGVLMILESFGREYPFWVAPLNTTLLLVFFLYLSWREIKLAEKKRDRREMNKRLDKIKFS